ncbi:MAG: hypothetical protein Q8N53_14695 [Longimicrobiales bacterium]|nr:hypothetical protein [Longimicrobiales bacterium]
MKARFRSQAALGLLALLGAGACVDGRDPTGLETSSSFAVAVVPSFAVSPTQAEVARLSRARIRAYDLESGEPMASLEQEIDPDAAEWAFDLTIQIPSGRLYRVVITVELSSDVVEWSGQAPPIPLAIGAEPTELKLIALLRGPLDNIGVSAVEMSHVPERLNEGDRGQAASAVTGGGVGSRVFYRSLTPAVLEVSREGAYRAIGPGEGRIEGRAGAVADTCVVAVPEQSVEVKDVEAVSGGVGDSVERLAPGLQDAAGAQAIVQSLGDFETAVNSRRPSRIQDAIAAARAALAAYGTPVIRYQDGPELSLIELVLD